MKPAIILALDVDNLKAARRFVTKLYPQIKIFKVGLQLFTACGPEAVSMVKDKGAEVFLDLKFFDIPNTVAQAVRQAVRLGVKMLTVHIMAGEEVLEVAVKVAGEESRRLGLKQPLLLGITVLTSKHTDSDEVLRLTKTALSCGLDGVVCSAREAALLRNKIKREFLIVTPGIRPSGSPLGDQRRTATVEQAVKAGSDFLVVGRPILEAVEPLSAATLLMKDLNLSYNKI